MGAHSAPEMRQLPAFGRRLRCIIKDILALQVQFSPDILGLKDLREDRGHPKRQGRCDRDQNF